MNSSSSTMFGALNVADGTVISSRIAANVRRSSRNSSLIEGQVQDRLDVHVIADNYGIHMSPNQVERLLAYVTTDLLGHTDRRSV